MEKISTSSIATQVKNDDFSREVDLLKKLQDSDNEPIIGEVRYGEDLGKNIKAFDAEGDAMKNMTRGDLLKELGKEDAGIEEIDGVVHIDEITGETSPAVPADENTTMINALQDLNKDETVARMTELNRQHIQLIAPTNYTEEQVDALCNMLEDKLLSVSKLDIDKFTTDKMKDFIGIDIYNNAKNFNQHPLSAMKSFLCSLKASFVEKTNIVNAMDELKTAMEFFNNKPLEVIQKEIYAELEKTPEAYPTEIHKYQAYLTAYIEYLATNEQNTFIQSEIDTAKSKLSSIADTLSFTTIKQRLSLLKNDIMVSFQDVKKLDRTILAFINMMDSDESMMIQFPVPKNFAPKDDPNAVLKLTSMWILFLEVIIMYRDYPGLQELSHADYYRVTELVNGVGVSTSEEQDKILGDIITKNNITPKILLNAKNCAILFTYALARIFNPKKLDSHKKYVLSYTMAILSNSMNRSYLAIAHRLIDTVVYEFTVKPATVDSGLSVVPDEKTETLTTEYGQSGNIEGEVQENPDVISI